MSDSDSIEGSGSGIPCTDCTDDQEGKNSLFSLP